MIEKKEKFSSNDFYTLMAEVTNLVDNDRPAIGASITLDKIEGFLKTGASMQTPEYARLATEFADRISNCKKMSVNVRPLEHRLSRIVKAQKDAERKRMPDTPGVTRSDSDTV